MNFKISTSAKSLGILAVVTGAKLNFTVEGNQLVMNGKTTNQDEDAKEAGNASLLAKYVRDWVNNSKGTMETRIKRMAEILRGFAHVTTFRTLNNSVRRSTDDGTVFPVGTYFYEGTSHPTKVAARTKATKKATTPAKVKKVAKVAPVAKAKPATSVAKTKKVTKRVKKVAAAPVVAEPVSVETPVAPVESVEAQ